MKTQSILFAYICLYFGKSMTVQGQNACVTTHSGYSRSVNNCPDGWERYREEKCFKLFSTGGPVTWFSANQTCGEHESRLASVHSKDELEFLKTYFTWEQFRKAETFDTWIGGFNKGGEIWMWADFTPFEYTDWYTGYPSVNQTEACVSLTTRSHHLNDNATFGKMYHSPCYHNTRGHILCQKYQVDVRRTVNTK